MILNQQNIQSEVFNKKKKSERVLKIIITVALLLLSTLFVYHFFGEKNTESDFIIGANVQEGTLTNSDIGSDGSNGKAAMSISLNGFPVFENGASEGNFNIVNPDSNALYMEVQVRLDETDEVIYESGAIPPGHFITNDRLAKALEKGEHSATAYVTIFDPDNMDANFNSADFNLLVTVKN